MAAKEIPMAGYASKLLNRVEFPISSAISERANLRSCARCEATGAAGFFSCTPDFRIELSIKVFMMRRKTHSACP